MDIRTFSIPGGRAENEDRVAGGFFSEGFFLAVADGLGAHGRGAEAAQAALEFLEAQLPERTFSKESLRELIIEANDHLLSTTAGKTTLALLWCRGGFALAAHTGDSRIYQFRGGNILYQSRDHSVSQLAAAVGEITEQEIRGHADRNKLIRCLGSTASGLPEVHSLELQPGDGLLLCSDGFWEPLWEDEMLSAYQSAACEADWLQTMTGIISGRLSENSDNSTAAVTIYGRRNT